MRPLAPDLSGGLNSSMQHSSRTRLALKTKAKSLARVRSAGTLPWLGFDRAQPNRSLLPGSIVDSTHWMVLRRPSEPAPVTRKVADGTRAGSLSLRLLFWCFRCTGRDSCLEFRPIGCSHLKEVLH